ncbi:hypothetical protein QTP88_006788 [Uroleucon formosanum]
MQALQVNEAPPPFTIEEVSRAVERTKRKNIAPGTPANNPIGYQLSFCKVLHGNQPGYKKCLQFLRLERSHDGTKLCRGSKYLKKVFQDYFSRRSFEPSAEE